MLPVIVLTGRPNVGKSTLYNRLTGTRDALVAEFPGLTRDRLYGYASHEGRPYIVVDTGGLEEELDSLAPQVAQQAQRALEEADAVLFIADARTGATAADSAIAKRLRILGKPLWLAVNKAEDVAEATIAAEFYPLGMGDPQPVSARQGLGVASLMQRVLAPFSATVPVLHDIRPDGRIRVAVVGRPNAGKSTLINRWLGEERVLASEQPGTTRDSIAIPFEQAGTSWLLVDTAGVRRRGKVEDSIEKFSVVKTLQAIDDAHVVVFVCDAREGITDQDAALLGHVIERGRALVLAINKWDGLDDSQRRNVERLLDVKLPFLDFARRHFISALHGSGIREVLASARKAHAAAARRVPTPEVTRVLERALAAYQPPLVRGRRIKLRYAHQGGQHPPRFIIHGNQTQELPASYRRYLMHAFRDAFDLWGTPVRLDFRTGHNPFAETGR
jgi:GTP-binding protein